MIAIINKLSHSECFPQSFGFKGALLDPALNPASGVLSILESPFRLPSSLQTCCAHNYQQNLEPIHCSIFLGYRKVFDKEWIFILIHKLIMNHFLSPLNKLIFSYIIDRNCHIKIKDFLSQQFFALFIVSQGSKICPRYLTYLRVKCSAKPIYF